MLRRVASLLLILCLLAIVLPACAAQPATWRALPIPAGHSPAATNGSDQPLTYRTLRIGLPDGSRRVLFSQEDSAERVPAGGSLSMRFVADQPFTKAGLLAAAWGDAGVRARLVLRRADGSQIAEQTTDPLRDRTWIDIETAQQPPGEYQLELGQAGSGAIGWWGQHLQAEDVAAPPGFAAPSVADLSLGPVTVPAGLRVTKLIVRGGLSSYDHGIGWWRDYELQGDTGDRQFIGDSAGSVRIDYQSGVQDTIPLVFGWTLWWHTHYDSDAWGGPFLEPFASNPSAKAALQSSLRLNALGGGLAPYWWEFRPRPEPIKQITLLDNPGKQGYPIIAGISVETTDRADSLQPVNPPAWDDARAVTPKDLQERTWQTATASLAATLYLTNVPGDLPAAQPTVPDLTFSGTPGAALLTNIWRANLSDLRTKYGPDGRFHTSTPGAPDYGSYQGIGTWNTNAGYFANQVWARDLGRASLELLRQGDYERVEPGLVFAGDRLYDLPNSFPKIQRDGKPLPPHWTTVLGEPLYLDTSRRGWGNQENDSAGLLLLAYARAWQARGNDQTWLVRHVGTVRDAADWFLEQLNHPELWDGRDGLLYGEGEAANDGGYDVLSNSLAWRALDAAAPMLAAVGEPDRAAAYRSAAAAIRHAINTKLVEATPSGEAWQAAAWNWGYGNDSLGPLLAAADTGDYDLTTLNDTERALARATYRRQLQRCPDLLCIRTVGYGQAYLAQAALLMDDTASAATLLGNLATHIIDSRLSPYLVPEGVAVKPDGSAWYRTGDLGNAVHQAEVLKALALVGGVEVNLDGRARLLPRLPDGWQSLEVKEWPVPGGAVSMKIERLGTSLRAAVSLPGTMPVRLGPVASAGAVTLDGAPVAARVVTSGGADWVWLDSVPAGSHQITIGQ